MSWLLRLLALGTFAPFVAADSHPPNIVLIVAEDMGLRVGAYGDEVARTPNIDQLASEGFALPIPLPLQAFARLTGLL